MYVCIYQCIALDNMSRDKLSSKWKSWFSDQKRFWRNILNRVI